MDTLDRGRTSCCCGDVLDPWRSLRPFTLFRRSLFGERVRCDPTPFAPEGDLRGCTLNSECNTPLVCAFERCHSECYTSRDCVAPQLCVRAGAVGVCQLPDEVSCKTQVDCRGTLVCAPQGQCLRGCTSNASCLTYQACVGGFCVQTATDGGADDAAGGDSQSHETETDAGRNTQTVDASLPSDDGGPDVTLQDSATTSDTSMVIPMHPILDTFNRADGPLNSSGVTEWLEGDHPALDTYAVAANQLSGLAAATAPIFWSEPFGGASTTISAL